MGHRSACECLTFNSLFALLFIVMLSLGFFALPDSEPGETITFITMLFYALLTDTIH